MTAAPFILWLDDPEAAGNRLLGGKFSSLGLSVAAGLPVPPGFGITTSAYRAFMAESGLAPEAARVRQAAATLPPERLSGETVGLLEGIATRPLPARLEDAVAAAYAALERRAGMAAVPVAVRSSGESEDLAGASFAGQYETFLWISGPEALLRHMRKCWAGMFGDAVLSYRQDGKVVAAMADFGICVGVQQMVQARAAGVAFTLDPINGDRSKVVMEACWGLGEGVVKGEVTPSRFAVDKVTRDITTRAFSPQAEEYRFDEASGTVGLFPVEDARREICCLSDRNVLDLVELARGIEIARGAPQDIEWAIGPDDDLWVLQVRPETVWSSRPARPVAAISSPVSHVLMRMAGVPLAGRNRGS